MNKAKGAIKYSITDPAPGLGVAISYSYKNNRFSVTYKKEGTFPSNSLKAHTEFLCWLDKQLEHPSHVDVCMQETEVTNRDIPFIAFLGHLVQAITLSGRGVGLKIAALSEGADPCKKES